MIVLKTTDRITVLLISKDDNEKFREGPAAFRDWSQPSHLRYARLFILLFISLRHSHSAPVKAGM